MFVNTCADKERWYTFRCIYYTAILKRFCILTGVHYYLTHPKREVMLIDAL